MLRFSRPFMGVGLLFGALNVGAADYWVSPDGTGDGLSRENPSGSLKAVSRLAVQGDVIHMLRGTHVVSDEPELAGDVTLVGETGNRDEVILDAQKAGRAIVATGRQGILIKDLTIVNGKTQYDGGGICTTTASLIERDPRLNYTVENCVVRDCTASYMGGAGVGGFWTNCVISSCRVTAENTAYSGLACNGWGGGVFGGELVDCVVSNCWAIESGGGVAGGRDNVGHLLPLVATRCTIRENRSETGNGGGAAGWNRYEYNQRCTLIGCTISGNQANPKDDSDLGSGRSLGGGIASSYAEGCTIAENYGRRNGGGSWDSLSVGCTYRGNSTMGCGGAGIEAEFVDCRLDGNKSYDAVGGATYNCNTRNCIVVNNETSQYGTLCLGTHIGDIVAYNTAYWAENGGALDTDGSGPCSAVNCTFLSNSGGAAAVMRATLTNCIIWGQAGQTTFKDIVSMSHCFIPPGENPGYADFDKNGNKSGPRAGFPSETSDDYITNVRALDAIAQTDLTALNLKLDSPCVNAGVNQAWMADARDVFGTKRIRQQIVDVGALECNAKLGFLLMLR